ncbi:nucleotide-diphospho-sugar transferase [Glomus cerebriforme]|uniref:Nucleotide-diphospho-sugar transferase n=1 Tax=Glomus cerebriforme TaxID=658196 RepID=A0A397TCI7_9GLOM|nr:nucleotide-diphospho-sugar transferase [Glomus cerebriforme]
MSLKILILGAGYGTRLQRDLLNDTTNKYSHLLGVPKALLPLGGKDALITLWLDALIESNIDITTSVYIVTNSPSYLSFISWAEAHNIPTKNIFNDNSTSNENRLGAVEDIVFAIKKIPLQNSNLLIIGGDTLFLKDFNFKKLYKKFNLINSNDEGCLVTTYKVNDDDVHKLGILELNEENQVISFLEKPSPQSTISRTGCPCFYFLHNNSLRLLQEFLEESKNNPNHTIEDRDATGKFLAWVINNKKFKFFAENVQGRIDVGGLQSYIDANKYFDNSTFLTL